MHKKIYARRILDRYNLRCRGVPLGTVGIASKVDGGFVHFTSGKITRILLASDIEEITEKVYVLECLKGNAI